jgi:hypothetical protein
MAAPLKIKDKIDKEILSEILKNVVSPKDNNIADTKTTKNNESQNRGEHNTRDSSLPQKNEINKEDSKDAPIPPSFGHSKTEKIITPANFKDIKEIHPHEQVRVVPDNPKEIEEGQTVRFD